MTARLIIEAGYCGVEASIDDWHAAGRYLALPGGPTLQRMACLNAEEARRQADYINQQVAIQAANRVRQPVPAE